MTHQNLVLTEKAIKAHTKRLQKELKNINQDLSLGETQNIFAKSLGFNNFHELKKTLIHKTDIQFKNNENLLFEQLIEKSKNQLSINKVFLENCNYGNLKIIKILFENDKIINKPSLSAKDEHGNEYGAIYQATLSGNLQLVKYLLEELHMPMVNDPYIFFYCRKGEIFKYIYSIFKKELENEEYFNKFKRILLNDCFYDYDVFKEILNMSIFNKSELEDLLYHIVNPCVYDTSEEILNKNKIISSLITMGYDKHLYKEDYNIFLKIMQYLNSYERDFPKSPQYYGNKIRAIKEILIYIDTNHNYLSYPYIKECIHYFKENPQMLEAEYKDFNNLYLKKLII